MSEKWHSRFMELTRLVATWSKTPVEGTDRGVGCVLVSPGRVVLAIGYSGLPRGINDDVDHRHRRPQKYMWYEHAERNAIYGSTRGRNLHMGRS